MMRSLVLLCFLLVGHVSYADDPYLDKKGAIAKSAGDLLYLGDVHKRTGYEKIVRIIRKGEAIQLCTGRVYDFSAKSFKDFPAHIESFTLKAEVKDGAPALFKKGGFTRYILEDEKLRKQCDLASDEIISLVDKEFPKDVRNGLSQGDRFDDSVNRVFLVEYFQMGKGYKYVILLDRGMEVDKLLKYIISGEALQ